MAILDVKGKLYKKLPAKKVGKKGFPKQEFIIRETVLTKKEHPVTNYIKISAFGSDAVDSLNFYNIGEEVIVTVIVNGREWEKDGEKSYFTELSMYKINPVVDEESDQRTPRREPTPAPKKENADDLEAYQDDLPF